MKFIALGVCGFICCIAIIVIMLIRRKKVSDDSAIGAVQNTDFIDVIANYKRAELAKNPWNMSFETYQAIGTTCAILFSVTVYVLTSSVLYGVLAAIVGLLIPELLVKLQNSKQRTNFEERYARALRQLAAGLKSGLSIHQAVEDVANSPFVHDRIKKEFQQLSAELKLSVPIQQAFENFALRVKCQDALDVAIAIKVQTRVGGREAEVVEGIAKNISDRLMLRKEINSMFAGSNATIMVMDILPFAVVAFLFVAAPGYMAPYYASTLLMVILVALLAFMGIGSIVIHKLVDKMRRDCGI